jgi:flagella basal body P-ring formation protein FlgA
MKRLVLILLFPAVCLSGADEKIETLIAAEWVPDLVHVEWKFTGKPVPALESAKEIWVEEPKPLRFIGTIQLNIGFVTEEGDTLHVRISGKARVIGSLLTTNAYVPAGTLLTNEMLTRNEVDFANVRENPLTSFDASQEWITARGLTAGRPLYQKDIKPLPVVQRGNNVTVEYAQNNIRISFAARALENGGKGESIPVKLEQMDGRCINAVVAGTNLLHYNPNANN